ncbi:MAG: hypothetical protein ABJN26_15900 [Stappiaceae bacterium]
MRKQYHSRPVGSDIHIWDVHKLVRATNGLDILSVPVEEIAEIDENWWYQDPGAVPTPRSFAHHMSLVQKTDLTHPVILCAQGRLMDGMHRVVRALAENREHIRAVRFPVTPAPDFMNIPLDDLPYADEEI